MCVLCVGCPFAGGRVGVACQRHGRGAAWPSGRAAVRTWPLLDRVCARACMCVRACVRASLLRTHPCPPPPLSFEGMMFCDLMSTVYCDTCSMAWVRWRIGSTLAPTPSPCPNRSSPLPSPSPLVTRVPGVLRCLTPPAARPTERGQLAAGGRHGNSRKRCRRTVLCLWMARSLALLRALRQWAPLMHRPHLQLPGVWGLRPCTRSWRRTQSHVWTTRGPRGAACPR